MDPILIVAGESSGERYGAGLVREFRKLYPEARFFGIGGKQMSSEGVEILFPMEHLAVMGIFEVISQVPRIRQIFKDVPKVYHSDWQAQDGRKGCVLINWTGADETVQVPLAEGRTAHRIDEHGRTRIAGAGRIAVSVPARSVVLVEET